MLVINPLICEEVWLPSWTREVVLYNKDSALVSEEEKLPGSCKGPSNTGSSTADLVKWNRPQKKLTSTFWISLINASGGSTTVEWCQSTEVAKMLKTKILPMQDNCSWAQLHRDNRALIFSARPSQFFFWNSSLPRNTPKHFIPSLLHCSPSSKVGSLIPFQQRTFTFDPVDVCKRCFLV